MRTVTPVPVLRSRTAAAAAVTGLTLVALTALPSAAWAQDLGGSCSLLDYRTLRRDPIPGTAHAIWWLGAPDLSCGDGARVQADSAISYSESGRNQLIGNVVILDAETELRATEADHYEVQGQLFARGNVTFRDLGTGREMSGDTLTLLEAGPSGGEDRLTLRGRPAVASLPREGATAGEPAPAGAYRIAARGLRFEGDRYVWGTGEVAVERDSLRIFADSLAFDRQTGNLLVVGGARMEEGGTVFEGDRMQVRMRDDIVESIEIEGHGHVVNDQIELTAWTISITIQEEKVQRVLADRGAGGETSDVPRLLTEEFFIVGDQLDILSPDEVPDRVRALGRAWAQTHAMGDPLPPLDALPSERLARGPLTPEALADDWIQADEIDVLFGRVEPATRPANAGRNDDEYYVRQLTGSGRARTLYRSPPEDAEGAAPQAGPDAPDAPPQTPLDPPEPDRADRPISYTLADWIAVYLAEDGEVQSIEAVGQVLGLQLDPETGRATAGSAPTANGPATPPDGSVPTTGGAP